MYADDSLDRIGLRLEAELHMIHDSIGIRSRVIIHESGYVQRFHFPLFNWIVEAIDHLSIIVIGH